MKILDKYIELIEKGYCDDCNELNCIDNFPQEKIVQEIKDLQKKAELGEHYKHLYSEVKKQKDDVVEYIKNNINYYYDEDLEESVYQDEISGNEVLRMLGEIDVED